MLLLPLRTPKLLMGPFVLMVRRGRIGLKYVAGGGAGAAVALGSMSVGNSRPNSRLPASRMKAAPWALTVAGSVRRKAVEQAMPMMPSVRALTAVTRKAAAS